ncbi:unnamed protein product [Amaranthus hypochondriacus]
MKIQEKSKYTGRIFDAQVCSGSGGGPGRWRRNKGKSVAAAADKVEYIGRLIGKLRRLAGDGGIEVEICWWVVAGERWTLRKKDPVLFEVFEHGKKERRGEGGGDWKSFVLTRNRRKVAGGVNTAILIGVGDLRKMSEINFSFLGVFGFQEREKIGGEVKMYEEATEKSGGFAGVGKGAERVGKKWTVHQCKKRKKYG